MKALTLTQPWATLVAIGAKKIDTRSWSVAYRGPLAIHAAKGYPKEAARLCLTDPFLPVLKGVGMIQFGAWHPSNNDLPLGCIIATCEVVNCIEIVRHTILPACPELDFGDYTIGRYMWILENIMPLDRPVPAKGSLRLWNWETNLERSEA